MAWETGVQSLFESYQRLKNKKTVLDAFLLNTQSYKVGIIGGANGVMVIVVGNGHGDTSSNPRRDWLHFT